MYCHHNNGGSIYSLEIYATIEKISFLAAIPGWEIKFHKRNKNFYYLILHPSKKSNFKQKTKIKVDKLFQYEHFTIPGIFVISTLAKSEEVVTFP